MALPLVADPAPRLYNLFPTLAGPLSDWGPHLRRAQAMGFDWVYVNPIHFPGFSGSLYAVKDYYALHPLLDAGDGRTPADQVRAMVEGAHGLGLKVMLDLVVNHTAKDSPWVTDHPDWYLRDGAGVVQSPFAIDPANADNKTVWGDLAELDFSPRPARDRMVAELAAISRHYAGLGVDGFRCDAAYKVPADVWEEIIAAARSVRSDCLFAAETLGCRLPEIEGLRPAGFAYLFNSSKWWDFRESWLLDQYMAFRSLAPSIAFPESHDTPRLAADLPRAWPTWKIEAAYRRAWLFAAAFSSGVMMPMGFEYGFGRKPDVVRTRPKDWEKGRFDLTDFVGAVNDLKARVRVLNWEGPQVSVDLTGPDDAAVDACALVRTAEHDPDVSVLLINRDPKHAATVTLAAVEVALKASGGGGLAARPLSEVTPGQEAPASGADGTTPLTLEPGGMRLLLHDPRGTP